MSKNPIVTDEMRSRAEQYARGILEASGGLVQELAAGLSKSMAGLMTAEDHESLNWTNIARSYALSLAGGDGGVVAHIDPDLLSNLPGGLATISQGREIDNLVAQFWYKQEGQRRYNAPYRICGLPLPELVILPDGETVIHRDDLPGVALNQIRLAFQMMRLVDETMARGYWLMIMPVMLKLLGHTPTLGSFVKSISELLGDLRAVADEATCPEDSSGLYGALGLLGNNLEWIRAFCAELDSAVTVGEPRPGGLLPDPEIPGGTDLLAAESEQVDAPTTDEKIRAHMAEVMLRLEAQGATGLPDTPAEFFGQVSASIGEDEWRRLECPSGGMRDHLIGGGDYHHEECDNTLGG